MHTPSDQIEVARKAREILGMERERNPASFSVPQRSIDSSTVTAAHGLSPSPAVNLQFPRNLTRNPG